MSRLQWDQPGERKFSSGVDKGVLYKLSEGAYSNGYAWNGLTAVTENPSGAEPSPLWANNRKYATLMSQEEFGGNIEAYTYPDEFASCDGSAAIATGVYVSQQHRDTFGLSYVTGIGNDIDGLDHGYEIHLVYGCLASPSEKSHASVNDSPEAETLSWEFSTTPVDVPACKPTSHIKIDSTTVDATQLAAFEAILYGTNATAAVGTSGEAGYVAAVEATTPRLPLPAEIITLFPSAQVG